MEFLYLIWNGLVISALFWFGWTGLFQAKQSRDEMRRIAKLNGLPPPFELPLMWQRIASAIMLLAGISCVAALVMSMTAQTAP